jgi:ABC-type phosphate/phosphonate transport system ATPase subunit
LSYVRAHELAEGQVVSLLEIDGIGKATLRALYKLEVDTADKVLAAPTSALLQELASYRLPVGKITQRQETIEGWKGQIQRLKDSRKSCPVDRA